MPQLQPHRNGANPRNHAAGAQKSRLQWTADLHALFLRAIDHLGGPDRVSPKGILEFMNIEGLTIYHIKSHLQKHRLQLRSEGRQAASGEAGPSGGGGQRGYGDHQSGGDPGSGVSSGLGQRVQRRGPEPEGGTAAAAAAQLARMATSGLMQLAGAEEPPPATQQPALPLPLPLRPLPLRPTAVKVEPTGRPSDSHGAVPDPAPGGQGPNQSLGWFGGLGLNGAWEGARASGGGDDEAEARRAGAADLAFMALQFAAAREGGRGAGGADSFSGRGETLAAPWAVSWAPPAQGGEAAADGGRGLAEPPPLAASAAAAATEPSSSSASALHPQGLWEGAGGKEGSAAPGEGPEDEQEVRHLPQLKVGKLQRQLMQQQVQAGLRACEAGSREKSRLQWTSELHTHFLNAVSKLGGPEEAHPSAILRLMNMDGLNIYHIKSHLQKHRLQLKTSGEGGGAGGPGASGQSNLDLFRGAGGYGATASSARAEGETLVAAGAAMAEPPASRAPSASGAVDSGGGLGANLEAGAVGIAPGLGSGLRAGSNLYPGPGPGPGPGAGLGFEARARFDPGLGQGPGPGLGFGPGLGYGFLGERAASSQVQAASLLLAAAVASAEPLAASLGGAGQGQGMGTAGSASLPPVAALGVKAEELLETHHAPPVPRAAAAVMSAAAAAAERSSIPSSSAAAVAPAEAPGPRGIPPPQQQRPPAAGTAAGPAAASGAAEDLAGAERRVRVLRDSVAFQMELDRRLQEQLEVQRKLKLSLDAHERFMSSLGEQGDPRNPPAAAAAPGDPSPEPHPLPSAPAPAPMPAPAPAQQHGPGAGSVDGRRPAPVDPGGLGGEYAQEEGGGSPPTTLPPKRTKHAPSDA